MNRASEKLCSNCEYEHRATEAEPCSGCSNGGGDDGSPLLWQPPLRAGMALLFAEWMQAFAAFQGAYDTPVARRKDADEYSEDARKRMRSFNERFRELAGLQPSGDVLGGCPSPSSLWDSGDSGPVLPDTL